MAQSDIGEDDGNNLNHQINDIIVNIKIPPDNLEFSDFKLVLIILTCDILFLSLASNRATGAWPFTSGLHDEVLPWV